MLCYIHHEVPSVMSSCTASLASVTLSSMFCRLSAASLPSWRITIDKFRSASLCLLCTHQRLVKLLRLCTCAHKYLWRILLHSEAEVLSDKDKLGSRMDLCNFASHGQKVTGWKAGEFLDFLCILYFSSLDVKSSSVSSRDISRYHRHRWEVYLGLGLLG